eukprot:scaffold48028_cov17-Tisochrysis_lutea.AAC.4
MHSPAVFWLSNLRAAGSGSLQFQYPHHTPFNITLSQHAASLESGSGTHAHLDGILSQHAAVQLHRRQAQVLCDLTVLDLHHVLDRASLDPFCCDRAAGDGRAAAKGLEARVCDVAVLIHLRALISMVSMKASKHASVM